MATTRSPIKVPCENEHLSDKENAPDFDEDTLQGEQCSTPALIIVRKTSIPSLSFKNVSRSGEGYINCMTYLNDILASHDSLLWWQYVVCLEDLGCTNLCCFLFKQCEASTQSY